MSLKLPFQLPVPLVLDLIAITRMLYAKEQQAGGHPVKLQEIADIGRSLKEALPMAKGRPGTVGMAMAWQRAYAACEALGKLLAEEQALPLLQAVEGKMLKARRGG